MATRFALNDITDQDILACAAKVAAMMVQARDEDDTIACLLAIQGSIEVFAAQAATPLEQGLSEALRVMSAEMIRRSDDHRHPHAKAARTFVSEDTRHAVRFRRRRKPAS